MRLWSKHTILPFLALAGKHETTSPLTWQFGSATCLCARLGGVRRSPEQAGRSISGLWMYDTHEAKF